MTEIWVKGDILQIDPEHDHIFGGCFMLVTEPKEWGAQGFFDVPGEGKAFYRVDHENATRVGFAEWLPEEEEEDN